MASVLTASPASAAQEVQVDIGGGAYMTITNVVEQVPAEVPLYIAESPVTVTFYGEGLCRETVEYYTQGEVTDYGITLDGFVDYVPFAVKNYTYFGETEVHDALAEPPEDLVVYVSGNYVTLTEPGYYVVTAAPEAAVGAEVVIQITSEAAPEPAVTPDPAVVSAVPTPSKVLVNGQEISFAAYLINGNNYFKLRDIGKAMDFGVTWNADTNTVGIDSTTSYTE